MFRFSALPKRWIRVTAPVCVAGQRPDQFDGGRKVTAAHCPLNVLGSGDNSLWRGTSQAAAASINPNTPE
jgi:hypothetical protein